MLFRSVVVDLLQLAQQHRSRSFLWKTFESLSRAINHFQMREQIIQTRKLNCMRIRK